MHSRYTWHKGRVVMLSPAQWCSSVQLLQLASLCLVHGIYLNYITVVALKVEVCHRGFQLVCIVT